MGQYHQSNVVLLFHHCVVVLVYCCVDVLLYYCVGVLLCCGVVVLVYWCIAVLLCCLCLRDLWYVVVTYATTIISSSKIRQNPHQLQLQIPH